MKITLYGCEICTLDNNTRHVKFVVSELWDAVEADVEYGTDCRPAICKFFGM